MIAANMGMLVAGAVLVALMHAHMRRPKPPPPPLRSDWEVDISRWRHQGEQPTFYYDGNRRLVNEGVVTDLLARI